MRHTFLILAGIAAVLAAMSCSGIKKENIIEPGVAIRHDDFEYTVVGCQRTHELKLSDEIVTAEGMFYIITFNVKNNARNVHHTWNNRIAYLIAEDSSTYENNIELQKKLNASSSFGFKEEYITPFQSEDTTKLIFDVPVTTQKLYLKVRGKIYLVDFLDGSGFEKTKVSLFTN